MKEKKSRKKEAEPEESCGPLTETERVQRSAATKDCDCGGNTKQMYDVT